jgi:hypothetical protein
MVQIEEQSSFSFGHLGDGKCQAHVSGWSASVKPERPSSRDRIASSFKVTGAFADQT